MTRFFWAFHQGKCVHCPIEVVNLMARVAYQAWKCLWGWGSRRCGEEAAWGFAGARGGGCRPPAHWRRGSRGPGRNLPEKVLDQIWTSFLEKSITQNIRIVTSAIFLTVTTIRGTAGVLGSDVREGYSSIFRQTFIHWRNSWIIWNWFLDIFFSRCMEWGRLGSLGQWFLDWIGLFRHFCFWMYGFGGAWIFWSGAFGVTSLLDSWRLSLAWLLHLKVQRVHCQSNYFTRPSFSLQVNFLTYQRILTHYRWQYIPGCHDLSSSARKWSQPLASMIRDGEPGRVYLKGHDYGKYSF